MSQILTFSISKIFPGMSNMPRRQAPRGSHIFFHSYPSMTRLLGHDGWTSSRVLVLDRDPELPDPHVRHGPEHVYHFRLRHHLCLRGALYARGTGWKTYVMNASWTFALLAFIWFF